MGRGKQTAKIKKENTSGDIVEFKRKKPNSIVDEPVENSMFIIIENLTKRTSELIIIETQLNDPISNVKTKIKEKTGLHAYEQSLIYAGDYLHDDRTLSYYNIQNQSKIYLVLKDGVKIIIQKWNRQQFDLIVQITDTIRDIKRKIEERENIPVSEQLLLRRNKLLDNELTLIDLDHHEHLTTPLILRIKNPIEIIIKTLTNKNVVLEVDSNDTVRKVKEDFQIQEGVPVDQHRLIFNGRQLDHDRTLVEYDIGEGSIIHSVLVLRGS